MPSNIDILIIFNVKKEAKDKRPIWALMCAHESPKRVLRIVNIQRWTLKLKLLTIREILFFLKFDTISQVGPNPYNLNNSESPIVLRVVYTCTKLGDH